MHELLTSATSAASQAKGKGNGHGLFKGKTCYPLSPKREGEMEAEVDQLRLILKTLGKPAEGDLCFLEEKKHVEYVHKLSKGVPSPSLLSPFTSLEPGFSEILQSML